MQYRFVKAGFLDIPIIYDLIVEGVDSGVFFIDRPTGTGLMRLFLWLVHAVTLTKLPERLRKRSQVSLDVFYLDGETIGFVILTASREMPLKINLSMCAILPQFRGLGHGTAMIRTLLGNLPKETTISAACAKSARSMQAVCKHLGFKRVGQLSAAGRENLQVYRYRTSVRPNNRSGDMAARKPAHR